MTLTTSFLGFSPELLTFLANLTANNSREWFQAHRAEYEELLLDPARAFVLAMGDALASLDADIHAEPRIHGSILAITRDTRFSADKTPYKTHLDLWFWQGSGPSRERPGYFLRLAQQSLILGAGMHAFSVEGRLERYRQAVLDPILGAQLEHVAQAIQPTVVQGCTYARVPRGLPTDHPRADWLRHSGLFAERTLDPVPHDVFSPRAVDLCRETFQQLAPLQRWLVNLFPA
jgi:uncharacterized protein (TIGR02453 family)